MAKNEILSEIKKAEESAKSMVDDAIDSKNKRISDARAEAREILRQAEIDAHKAAQDSFKVGEEKILEERDKIVNDGEKNALAMSQKAQANIDKSVNYLVQEFERAVLNE
ncbi:ATP synthase [Methanosarcina sp. 2.H.T.1A.6]|jgi:V/A-type H+-transporting ATPase subunit G/H|uniref:ATP synthase archaeal subunit H n=1 Tax=unclassified Methanosarcina TaxID=2644672 RepID=UPI00062183F4|nr:MULTISPECIES: ATP synthase archaeal subunit H [unclassified Methanosarcina]KKG11144.1 ATP synthase [Methanosarcina sp. 2.H.A.1B.4]KKG13452.1 ATP synthase [Methanosarcina sp. 2.H.T.1A.3]KKG23507.1 ATP synthase [Methanosarcina sp. 2.H.T.1A.6]KKG24671.1 ATP synthase [Methanosarcina sp. 2.H.T.1A.15]KKG24694.1 ATP synthase [Methanosarcina sp. 2.H.T.1A.8]